MKYKIIMGVLVISLIPILSGCWFGPKYNQKDVVTSEILIVEEWAVESNGGYDYITLDQDASFEVFAYPDEVDSGSWVFEDNSLILDFNSETENRIYTDIHFKKDGVLYAMTDGNEERWYVQKIK